MAEAAAKAAARGVRSMVGFTYRRVPAIGLARKLVADGRLGEIRHVRAQYLQDWIADPAAPMSWRLDKDKAGSGALGDIGAHIIDLTQFVTGQRSPASARCWRPSSRSGRCPRPAGSLSGVGGEGTGTVTVDDAARLPRPVHRRGARRLRGDPVRPRPQERHPDRDQRLGGQPGLRLRGHERPAVLRRQRAGGVRRLPPDHRHRARAPLRRGVVAARARPRLRARLHPPGRRPRQRHRRGRPTRRRRSPTACRSSGCSPPSSAAPPTAPPGPRSLPDHPDSWHRSPPSTEEDAPMPRPSRCSPASGPTCRSRRWAGSPPSGATTAWRSPAGATTSTSSAPRTTTPTSPERLELLKRHGLQVFAISNHLNGQAVCDDPIDERHRGILPRASGATATPRACGSGPPRR